MASTEAQTSLTGASSTGAGSTVDFTTAKRNVTLMVVPSATLTAGVLTVEGSMDGVSWAVIRVVELADRQNSVVNFTGYALRYWRASLARAVTGGTVKATFMEADS